MMSTTALAQYPIEYDFQDSAMGGWENNTGNLHAGWLAPEHLSFDIPEDGYQNDVGLAFKSPILSHLSCDSIKVTYDIDFDIRPVDIIYFRYRLSSGGWISEILTATGVHTYNLPRTTVQFQLSLHTFGGGVDTAGHYLNMDYFYIDCYPLLPSAPVVSGTSVVATSSTGTPSNPTPTGVTYVRKADGRIERVCLIEKR